MQHHLKQPDRPPSPIEPTGFFTGIQIRPIVIGVILDVFATIALATGYYALFVARDFSGPGDLAEDAYAAYWNSSDGLMMSLLLGSLGTAIGGFYAAYKAGTLEMKHGALVGVGSILLGLVLHSGGAEREMPDWFIALSLVAAIPAGALGGFLAEVFKNMTAPRRPSRSGAF